MCFYSKQSKSALELQNRFNATFENGNQYSPAIYNGFQFPKTPIIANVDKDKIKLFHWGLIPHWAKDNSIRKNTLNARIETIGEKPAFRASVTNRCLVLVDGFYEWQWLDEKGKNKKKYLITLPDNGAFAFAGLWSEWVEKYTGETVKTYTILTKEANEFMSIIHNKEKRMPVILTQSNEIDWLNGQEINNIETELKATLV
jgi:putative SOS response-associated peptidase YedK